MFHNGGALKEAQGRWAGNQGYPGQGALAASAYYPQGPAGAAEEKRPEPLKRYIKEQLQAVSSGRFPRSDGPTSTHRNFPRRQNAYNRPSGTGKRGPYCEPLSPAWPRGPQIREPAGLSPPGGASSRAGYAQWRAVCLARRLLASRTSCAALDVEREFVPNQRAASPHQPRLIQPGGRRFLGLFAGPSALWPCVVQCHPS